jgi:hypothetical protein
VEFVQCAHFFLEKLLPMNSLGHIGVVWANLK